MQSFPAPRQSTDLRYNYDLNQLTGLHETLYEQHVIESCLTFILFKAPTVPTVPTWWSYKLSEEEDATPNGTQYGIMKRVVPYLRKLRNFYALFWRVSKRIEIHLLNLFSFSNGVHMTDIVQTLCGRPTLNFVKPFFGLVRFILRATLLKGLKLTFMYISSVIR